MTPVHDLCEIFSANADPYTRGAFALIAQACTAQNIELEKNFTEQGEKLAKCLARTGVLQAEIKRLRQQIHKLNRGKYGPSSEKGDENPPTGDDDGDSGTGTQNGEKAGTEAAQSSKDGEIRSKTSKPARTSKGRKKKVYPPHIPRKIVYREPESKVCSCGCEGRRIGEDVTERLVHVPASFYVLEERSPKYACSHCDKIMQAPATPKLLDYSQWADETIIAIAINKFADSLPYYRQEQIFLRLGVHIHRSTMSKAIGKVCQLLEPLHDCVHNYTIASGKIFMDESPVPLLMQGLGRTKKCYAWAACRDDRRWDPRSHPAVSFRFALSRAGVHAEELLKGFSGVLQADAYGAYDWLARQDRPEGPIILARCWAHTRRLFFDVHKATDSDIAAEMLKRIAQLYAFEEQIKGLPAEMRRRERWQYSKPLIDDMRSWLMRMQPKVPKSFTIGEAIRYTLKHFDELCVFLKNGRVEMDTNPVENAIRPLALLRKNALFCASELGGRSWMTMASLIGTCRLNGIEPQAYFGWLFKKMTAKHPLARYDELLPWHCPVGREAIDIQSLRSA